MPSPSEHIEVAVAAPVHKTFTYRVPDSGAAAIAVGKRVLAPFRNRSLTGYVLGPAAAGSGEGIRPVLEVLDEEPLFPPALVPFFRWIADYYLYPVGEVIKSALPGGINAASAWQATLTEAGCRSLSLGFLTASERRLLTFLLETPRNLRALERQSAAAGDAETLRSLMRRGLIERRRQLRSGRVGPRKTRVVTLAAAPPSLESLTPARRRIVEQLQRAGGRLTLGTLRQAVPSAGRLVKPLQAAGYLILGEQPVYRDPLGEQIAPDRPPSLTAEQERVVPPLTAALDGGFSVHLLQGVTGSGKTEVYLRVAAEALARGRGVLVLVPEIALISQMERCFRARFGQRVAVMHSALTAAERHDQWLRLANGRAAIAIGARSSVFAPLSRPGLIVVDEEHDASYKQESGLRYHARDLAVLRARQAECPVLLGSATPSVQSQFNAAQGKYRSHHLKHRVFERPLPQIVTVDLRRTDRRTRENAFLTPVLRKAMAETLDRGEQVLLFLNRRGYASLPLCSACGQALRCRRCDISLTLHQASGIYKCHYCGYSRSLRSVCPHCGGADIKPLGMGTEKVEGAVRHLFPNASVARMDHDTTRAKGATLKLLKGLRKRTIDVLVGTQIVAKGHDFPHITLVGVICADLSLNFPDFRAGERTFQLIAQVAGRAGRGEIAGRVILQTYNPDHFYVRTACSQDAQAFYAREIPLRRALRYPPLSKLVALRLRGRNRSRTAVYAQRLGESCRRLIAREPRFADGITVLGPTEAPIARIAGRHRWQMLLKGDRMRTLQRFLRLLMARHPELFSPAGVRVTIDVDPMSML
jgi:primosomal protein N' (replication factor Y)